jgi:ribosome-associated heat shock protein Hsp15
MSPATSSDRPQTDADRLRIDVWLDVACLFKTRSEAQRACNGGKVEVRGVRAKPHREVRPGDEIVITRSLGRRQRVIVRGVAETHVRKADARKLYEDVTPPPSPEEREAQRLDRILASQIRAAGTPGKRERRELRRLKERG